MIGLEADSLLTLKMATEMGLFEECNVINGHLPEIKDFKLPDMGQLMFGQKMPWISQETSSPETRIL
jgi:hypothetical protein